MNLMKKSKKIELFLIPLIVICCGSFFMAGCGHIFSKAVFPWETLHGKDLKTIKKGNQAMKAGDIKKARSIFQDLRQQATDPVIQQRSLYGLACADLALASNATEFKTAIKLWDQWIKQIPPGREGGDPHLIYPLLVSRLNGKKAFNARLQALKSQMQEKNNKNLQAKDQDIEALNTKLEIKNLEISKLEQKLHDLRIRIQTLEHQINAMKTIDQKIQEKKEKISTP